MKILADLNRSDLIFSFSLKVDIGVMPRSEEEFVEIMNEIIEESPESDCGV